MSTVPEALVRARADDRLLVACDVSPPKAAGVPEVERLRRLARADFLCCAYLPGRAVRLDSAVMALLLKRELGTDVIFNLATRDMNRLALSVHLMGAAALGLENAVALRGDDFSARDQRRVAAVHDTTPTQLVEVATRMNEGEDFRGTALAAPVPLCMGATMDFSRDFQSEVRLAVRKARAGARFFLTQSIYDATLPERFTAAYRAEAGEDLTVPVLWGVPVLAPGSIAFGDVPDSWTREMSAGRPGAETALEFLGELRARGVEAIYLVAPILKGGERDYEAAAEVLERIIGGEDR
jgi:5,10-methylenetetrahydrofolate reductase